MAPRGGFAQQLTQFGQRLFQPPSNTIRGVDADAFYSPLQPTTPIAPVGTEPRGFQYWAGQNLWWTPRPDAEYSAAQLKELATYPLARICISNVKDAICRIPWEIQLKPKPGESKKQLKDRAKGRQDIIKLNDFFERPDREHCWDDWLRPLLDDMLVIDAASILVRKTFKGDIAELAVTRGEMFCRYIDKNGFTPLPPEPAYAQNWWGIPLVNLSTDQLLYKPRSIVPRNTVSSQLYGMSQTEELSTELEIGVQRLLFVKAYYTEGSIPGVIQVVPRGTSPELIKEAMEWMNSELAGNLAARRQWRMVQGFNEPGKPDQIEFTKEQLLADAFDDLHIRKVAFGYGTSPQRLLKMMNRASSQSNQESAEEEGTLCYVNWLRKAIMNPLIQYYFKIPDAHWVPDISNESDPVKQMEVLTGYVKGSVLSPNAARERLGEDPDPAPEANMLGVVTGTGFVPLGLGTAQAGAEIDEKGNVSIKPKPQENQQEEPDEEDDEEPKPKPKNKPNGKANGHAAAVWAHCSKHGEFIPSCHLCSTAIRAQFDLEKKAAVKAARAKPLIHPGRLLRESILAKHAFEKVLVNRLKRMQRISEKQLQKAFKRTQKAELKKATDEEILKAIMKALADEWRELGDESELPIADAALAGAAAGSAQVEINDTDLIGKINAVARDWAAKRAAELVGMRRDDDGNLIQNPDAKWAISDTTRDKLRKIIKDVFAEESPKLSDIEDRIEQSGIFSDQRASMIARTEIARAQTQGNLDSWRHSGLVKTVEWILSADHDHDDECDQFAENSPYVIDEVPDLPAHVNCQCQIILGELAES